MYEFYKRELYALVNIVNVLLPENKTTGKLLRLIEICSDWMSIKNKINKNNTRQKHDLRSIMIHKASSS